MRRDGGRKGQLPAQLTRFDAHNWAAVGRTAGETHYSPLTEINRETVGQAQARLDARSRRGQRAGNSARGRRHHLCRRRLQHRLRGRCENRKVVVAIRSAGAAGRGQEAARRLRHPRSCVLQGKIVRRHARWPADRTGREKGTALWSTPTLEANDGSFISGAPRVFNDKVAIGFGDSGSVHGAVGVYDATTGKRLWRWETGAGGGAVWNAITYDPEANRLYVGTGNARGADAASNRFACSVVALNADSGELAWNYDTAPGDHLQCDSSTDITLATITIDGQPRKVICTRRRTAPFACSIAPRAGSSDQRS